MALFNRIRSDPVDHGLQMKQWFRPAGWILLAIFLLIFVSDRVINGRRGEEQHRQLMREFSAITPLPNASVVASTDNFSPWNSHKALVGATYKTSAPFSNIQEFYGRELESKGWYLVEDRSLTEWGKDYGGRELTYCKGTLAASVEYGDEARHGWTYALELSWGLHDCG